MPKGYPLNGRVTHGAAKNLARGTLQGFMVKGAYNLDPETHATIRRMAIADNVSFSEMLRTLVDWGLEAVGE